MISHRSFKTVICKCPWEALLTAQAPSLLPEGLGRYSETTYPRCYPGMISSGCFSGRHARCPGTLTPFPPGHRSRPLPGDDIPHRYPGTLAPSLKGTVTPAARGPPFLPDTATPFRTPAPGLPGDAGHACYPGIGLR